jgi:serine/threonine protein kinase
LKNFFIDMLKALYYCHNVVKVIHRDIKPDNIVINHNQEAVLIDFGVSFLQDQKNEDVLKTNIGTFIFYSPEMFSKTQEISGEASDLWALGITFYKLVTGRYPFEEAVSYYKLKESILEKDIDFDIIKHRDVKDLLRKMLQKDVTKRAKMGDILKSKWVTDNGRTKLDIELTE